MKIGDRIRIEGTNSIFDNKEGVIEEIFEDYNTCTIFVDFVPDENKKLRQNFSLENVFPVTQEPLGESKKHKTLVTNNEKSSKKDDKKENYDFSSLLTLNQALSKEYYKSLADVDVYKDRVLVSKKWKKSLDDIVTSLSKDDKYKAKLFNEINKDLKFIINKQFNMIHFNKIIGLVSKYDGKIMELKLGEINKNQVRILYFTAGDKIILANILIHRSPTLTEPEKNSANSIYDAVMSK